jgi:hypothetical protein
MRTAWKKIGCWMTTKSSSTGQYEMQMILIMAAVGGLRNREDGGWHLQQLAD